MRGLSSNPTIQWLTTAITTGTANAAAINYYCYRSFQSPAQLGKGLVGRRGVEVLLLRARACRRACKETSLHAAGAAGAAGSPQHRAGLRWTGLSELSYPSCLS